MTAMASAWFAVAFFLLPGFLISWLAGMRASEAAWAALPVTFGVIGMGGWLWGLTSARFNLWTYGVSLAIALALAAAWRFGFYRHARKRGRADGWRDALVPGGVKARLSDVAWVLPTAGMAVGAFLGARDRLNWQLRLPHGTWNIPQGWDVQWHANVVRFIMDTGVASATRMGELQNVETHAFSLYPVGFHAGVALFAEAAGLEPIPALNTAEAVLPAVALSISMGCLVLAFMRSKKLTAQIGAGLAAIAIYAAPQFLWVADYVGMWPYLFAMSMTGIVVWLFLAVPGCHPAALPAALAFLGVLTAHPSSVTVVVICVALSWLASTLVRPEVSRLSDTLWLAIPALAATLAFLPQMLAGSEQAQEVSGWQAAEASEDVDAWHTAFWMDTRHVAEFFPNYDPTIVLWLAGAGALALLLWRGQVWPALFYAVSLCATSYALSPVGGVWGDVLAQISSLHYNTAHRLILPVVMCVYAAAAIGVAAMIRLITLAPLAARKGSTVGRRATAVASAVAAVGIAAWAVPVVRADTTDSAARIYGSSRVDSRMVSDNDLAAFNWLGRQPAAREGYTMGDPTDGHSWIYAYNGVPTQSRHYQWPVGFPGSEFNIAFDDPDFAGKGLRGAPGEENIADRAIDRLDIRFYIISPGPFWAFQRPDLVMERSLWLSHEFTPVYRKGDVVIFAVNKEFSDDELAAMRRDAMDSGSDELFELTGPSEGSGSGATSTSSTTSAASGTSAEGGASASAASSGAGE